MKKNLVFLTGSGISKESGLATFRDFSDGLWNNYKIDEVATPEGWKKNPKQVLEFYNMRRKESANAEPNVAHKIIAELEKGFNVTIITQNVDDLHEKAGSTNIIHLHGQLNKVIEDNSGLVELPLLTAHIEGDLELGECSPRGIQWRPDVIWFNENVKQLSETFTAMHEADIYVVVGTSLNVYPANSLHDYAKDNCELFYVDPNALRNLNNIYGRHFEDKFNTIEQVATEGLVSLQSILCNRDTNYE